jgi:E3 ubiquitin-protein ligases UBR4 N-terminal
VLSDSLQSVANDVVVVWRVFSLPVLEPMTRVRLEKIVSITMSCLYASIAATTTMSIVSMAAGSTQLKSGSTSKDEEIDGYASLIVQKTVCIFL